MFRKERSLGIRVWHWSNAVLVTGLLGTVLMRDTVLSPRAVSAVLQDKLTAAGATVTTEQMRTATRSLIERLWEWHLVLGYVVSAVLLLRLGVYLLERRRAPAAPARTMQYRAVKGLHTSFYVALAVLSATGLQMAFKTSLPVSKPVQGWIHGLHENLMWYVIAFVVLHVVGVVRAEVTDDRGLISEMVGGK
jgi:cytochrome b561